MARTERRPRALISRRLTLRPISARDAAAMRRLLGDPVSMRFSDHGPLGASAARRWTSDAARLRGAGLGAWSVRLRDGGPAFGYASLRRSCRGRAALGLRLLGARIGRGYGREAALAMLAEAARGGFAAVLASVDPGNRRSAALIEGLGGRVVGRRLGLGYDHPDLVYEIRLSATFLSASGAAGAPRRGGARQPSLYLL